MSNYQCDIAMLMELINASPFNNLQPEYLMCSGITEDSRKIAKGFIFIARPGLESDGRHFIHQATAKGAVAVLCEATGIEQFVQAVNCSVSIFKVENIAGKLGKIGATFYQIPSNELTIIGVTGTNGKTSCTQLIARVAEKLKKKVAVMGTLGNGCLKELESTDNTTIDALTLQGHLAKFKNSNIDIVSMEVSSHALKQGRVNAVNFDIALFTNLTRDHLDYHGNMKSYADAKKILLVKNELKTVIINADDTTGLKFINDDTISAEKFSYSITPINAREPHNSVWTESAVFHDAGIVAEIATPWGAVDFKTSMIGQFNLSNCLAVITTLGSMGFSPKDVADQLSTMPFVKGRMERFGGEDKPLVIVDYAHTPDALKHVLQAIKPHTSHKLWVVVGCGGDRDRGKRPEMASIAEEYADHLVFTSDNPRSERVEDIVTEMQKGLHRYSSCEVEYDRELAIRNSISKAVLGDVVLIAGKGHETFQFTNKGKVPHSDIEIAEQSLTMGSWK
ncbi:MAG: UDP-N-acetylmuramoyl-L-alanyl-D-glutamate--2,6-diaminopimelate ligase [Gammaproteobacteria bacterium]|nr:UDP-N-acetylmuramoyl-L-alanyl-D-glutamate--2,6-diaminopimelate ligase [Gammaproteobacteria bacterium]